MSVPNALHAAPARYNDAVSPVLVLCTAPSLYPGQSLVFNAAFAFEERAATADAAAPAADMAAGQRRGSGNSIENCLMTLCRGSNPLYLHRNPGCERRAPANQNQVCGLGKSRSAEIPYLEGHGPKSQTRSEPMKRFRACLAASSPHQGAHL